MTEAAQLPTNIDSTMMTAFRSCPHKFFREFVLGLRPPTISIDLHAGACFASAIENTYRGIHEGGLRLEDALARSEAFFYKDWGDFTIPEYKRTAKTRERMWDAVWCDLDDKNRGYFNQYPPHTDHVQPYITEGGKPTFEYTFAIPLEPAGKQEQDWLGNKCLACGGHGMVAGVDYETSCQQCGGTGECYGKQFPLHPSGAPFLYSGRFDMLGSYLGKPVVRDEKTTGGSIGQDWAEKWRLRNQFLGYCWACQQCGLDVDTVVVRGVAIQKTQIVHQEAIVTFAQHLLGKWHEQLRRDLWRLRRMWDENYWDYNLGDTCTAYGNCIFLDSCQSATPDAWNSNFEVRRWNPLHKDPTAEVAKP